MAISSINFKPVQSNSTAHNERKVELDYNFPELAKNNETWKVDEIQNRFVRIENLYQEKTGQKIQKTATPIREAVVNLNPEHTMEDLKNLAKTLGEKYGIQCFQIHIHRDEGKSREEINHHAHMVFDWQDKRNGKSFKLNKLDMSKIQTVVANALQMERGELKVNSNRERLEPIEYKRQQEEIRVKKLQEEANLLEQKKNEAERFNAELRERKQGHFKLSGERTAKLAREGLRIPEELGDWREKDLSRAIEYQRRELESIGAEIEECERTANRIEGSREFIQGRRTYQDLARRYREAGGKA